MSIFYLCLLGLLIALAVPAALTCAYLAVATILSAAAVPMRCKEQRLRFDVVIPAHNEAMVIERTVASLRRLDWPAELFRVVVVADNCTDATATLARAAGAEVLERHDATLRGKGYALAFAFQASRARQWADAVVVIDADAEASSNLLQAFAARIEAGAEAVQAHYGVLNPWASWRTRLITIAKASFHIVRSRARERLGLSCGIRGNGWCVTHKLLAKVPYQAFSLTEDLEYGIDLGLAGYRVYYADEAHADADMVSGEQIASKQRRPLPADSLQNLAATDRRNTFTQPGMPGSGAGSVGAAAVIRGGKYSRAADRRRRCVLVVEFIAVLALSERSLRCGIAAIRAARLAA
jgi:hypothetical protein